MSLLTAQFLRNKVTSETITNTFEEIPFFFFSTSAPGWLFNNLHANPDRSSATAPLFNHEVFFLKFQEVSIKRVFMCDSVSRVVFHYLANFASMSSCRCTHRADCCGKDESVQSNFTALCRMTFKRGPPVSSHKVFIVLYVCLVICFAFLGRFQSFILFFFWDDATHMTWQ